MRSLIQVAVLLLLLPFVYSLKFDLVAQTGHSAKNERCIRNFASRDTLVVVTAIVSGNRGDGQMVNMHVRWLISGTSSRSEPVYLAPGFDTVADT